MHSLFYIKLYFTISSIGSAYNHTFFPIQRVMALSDEDIERARVLLSNTVGVLCRNSLRYGRELQVQGLIGVTVDGKQVFLVSIDELFLQAEDTSKVQVSLWPKCGKSRMKLVVGRNVLLWAKCV